MLTSAIPAVAAVYNYSGSTYYPAVPATYNEWNDDNPQQVQVASTNGNGYVIYTTQWQPWPQFPDPGTGTAAYWSPAAHQRPRRGARRPEHCPARIPPDSAMSAVCGTRPLEAFRSMCFTARPIQVFGSSPTPWADSFTPRRSVRGPRPITSPTGISSAPRTRRLPGDTAWPQTFNNVTDGLSNTILLGEAYAWCERAR